MTVTLANISLVNISSVQAATTDNIGTTNTDNTSATTDDITIKVSLENIRDIMTENSLAIKILDNKLKIAKESYQDAKDTKDAATKPTAAEYTTAVTDAVTGIVTNNYNSKGYADAVTAYDKTVSDYEKAKDDLKTARDNYDKGVEDNVYAAQQEYLTYLNDLSTKKINEDTVNINGKEAQVYKLQYESGFISKNDYINKVQKNTSVNDSNASNSAEELDKTKLCNILGISPEEKVKFTTDIIEDFQIISKINYADDLQQMLDNNVDIKIANDDITTLNDQIDAETNTTDSTDTIDSYKKDNSEISLKQLTNDTETKFEGQYNDLMNSYNSVKSSYDKIIQEQKEFEVTQTQYDYGFISQNGLDAAKLSLDKDNASFIKARNECYLKYLKYIEMKEGY
jgi:outer membrane protein TolC